VASLDGREASLVLTVSPCGERALFLLDLFVLSALGAELYPRDIASREDSSPAPMSKKSICVFRLELMLDMWAV
jgi:hypothetical protein